MEETKKLSKMTIEMGQKKIQVGRWWRHRDRIGTHDNFINKDRV